MTLPNKDTSDIWGKLTETAEDKRPITFLYIKLETFGLSDDLYIKMNARGKQLTNFENFKADLVWHIKGWDKNEDPKNTIAHKLDTTWTDDIFRKNNKDGKIDEIYFAFLNRYFLNALITAMKDELGNHSHEIYSWLANDANKITSEIAKKQVKEEREKAKQILDENGNLSIDKNSEIWEQKIIDAENTAVKLLNDWAQLCWDKYIFNPDSKTWKDRILTKEKYRS